MSGFCAILLKINYVKIYSHFASNSGKIYKRKECNECRGEEKETLKFAILLVHWQVCMAAKNLGYKR